jgi:hypothetical protein
MTIYNIPQSRLSILEKMISARTVLDLARSLRWHAVCDANPVADDWDNLGARDIAVKTDVILMSYDRAMAAIQTEINALMAGPEMI